MKQRTLRSFGTSAAVIAAALVFSGCSGGGSGPAVPQTAAATGRAKITMIWPARPKTTSRLIPLGANSVQVSFLAADGSTIQSQVLVRPLPANQQTDQTSILTAMPTSATFSNLPQGQLKVQATAFPSQDASGTAQATAAAPITIVAGQSTPINLTMGTTITRVDIVPHVVAFSGVPVVLTAIAYDADNNMVITNQWVWNNSNSEVLSLDAQGSFATVSAVGPGQSDITATETESDTLFTTTLGVAPVASPSPSF